MRRVRTGTARRRIRYADVGHLDAMDFGVPSRRRRAFLIGHKTKPVRVPQPSSVARTSAATALGWGAGEQVRTRGQPQAWRRQPVLGGQARLVPDRESPDLDPRIRRGPADQR